jgi:hypothetical protein
MDRRTGRMVETTAYATREMIGLPPVEWRVL